MKLVLEAGAEPLPGFKLTNFLGRGGFGEVWRAETDEGAPKAIKIASLGTSNPLECRELQGLQKIRHIRHPYLLSIERFEVIEDKLVIIMELAESNLGERYDECVERGMVGIPRIELLRYLYEAAEVLDMMNTQHALQHLDVKPENLFLLSGHVKVADFGLVSCNDTKLNRGSIAITPPYAAPEIFDGRIEPTADQFSLAVTYQELLTGVRPFRGNDIRALISQHLQQGPDLLPLPPADRLILRRALQRDSEKRFPSCRALISELSSASRYSPVGATNVTLNGTQNIAHNVTVHNSNESTQADVKPKRREVYPGPVETGSRPSNNLSRTFSQTLRPGFARTISYQTESKETEDSKPVHRPFYEAFVAFLPLEIFAHKLRGFLDSMGCDVLQCSDRRTVLCFGRKNFFARRGLFLQMDTFARNGTLGFRAVEVKIWSNDPNLAQDDFLNRAILLLRCLKAHLMATDKEPKIHINDETVRSILYG